MFFKNKENTNKDEKFSIYLIGENHQEDEESRNFLEDVAFEKKILFATEDARRHYP